MAKSKPEAMTPREKFLADRPEPDEKQERHLTAAKERVGEKRRDTSRSRFPAVKVGYLGPSSVMVAAPHSDDTGWSAQIADSLGTGDGRVAEFLQVTAGAAVQTAKVENQSDADRYADETEQLLAFTADGTPTNPVEAALLLQMAAVHRASMSMAGRALRTDRRDVEADYTRLMNQTARTFAAQAEALHKLRTGGKQQVEVRYVYVDARTQTVVNGAHGAGGGVENIQQPQTPGGAVGYAPAPGLPMWGADAGGDALSVASYPGQAPLPDARRKEPRRAEG